MNDLPLTSLRALAAVYETGGIRPAGRMLGIAHSAVSRHLKELELRLDVPLFEKADGRKSLLFTSQGEALARRSLEALKLLNTAVTSAREARRGNALVIAASPSFAVRWLLPRLNGFQKAHKHIEVSVVADQTRKTPEEEGADISIRMGRKPRRGNMLALMDDQLFPVAHASLLGRQDPAEIDLTAFPLIHDRDPNASWALWKDRHGPKDLNVRVGARFTSSDLVLRAAEQGIGVALARGRLVDEVLRNGSLIRLLEHQEVTLPDAYWIILNKDRRDHYAVRSFVDWMQMRVRET